MTTIGRSPGDLRLFSSRRPDGALEAPPRRSSPYGRNRVRSTSPQARVHRSRGARPTELSLASWETDGGTTEIPRERWPPGAQLTQKPFAARQRANKERSREDPGQHRQEYRRHRRPQRTDRRGTRERLREARGPPMSPLLSLGLPTTRAAELGEASPALRTNPKSASGRSAGAADPDRPAARSVPRQGRPAQSGVALVSSPRTTS